MKVDRKSKCCLDGLMRIASCTVRRHAVTHHKAVIGDREDQAVIVWDSGSIGGQLGANPGPTWGRPSTLPSI
jgi:hypothetical protein